MNPDFALPDDLLGCWWFEHLSAGLDVEMSPGSVVDDELDIVAFSGASSLVNDDGEFVTGEFPVWIWNATTLMGGGTISPEGNLKSNGSAQGGFEFILEP